MSLIHLTIDLSIILSTVELWSLELACLENHGLLELIRQSRQVLYIFNVKIHPMLEQQWIELSYSKHWPQGNFLCINSKHLAGLNQYWPNLNHSDAWYKLIIFHKGSSAMMILHMGKSKLTNSFIERNVSIKQLAAIY